jgi:putative transcriptional regulator
MARQEALQVYLRRFRFDAGEMSQKELADRVGVSRQTIISIERGGYEPSVALALRLARVFGARVEDLFKLHADGTEET